VVAATETAVKGIADRWTGVVPFLDKNAPESPPIFASAHSSLEQEEVVLATSE